jgi:glycosyltransferase involved in cell wall biosynthesis
MSLLEAMCSCTPIASKRLGGIPEVLHEGRAGIRVDAPAGEELAAASISRLRHEEGLRTQLAGRAESIVREYYTGRAMAVKHDNIYSIRDV